MLEKGGKSYNRGRDLYPLYPLYLMYHFLKNQAIRAVQSPENLDFATAQLVFEIQKKPDS